LLNRQQLKKIPGLKWAVQTLRSVFNILSLKTKSTQRVFSDIYRNNSWGSAESISGPGSEVEQTKVVVKILESVIQEKRITRMLDLPCGDFNWMQHVNLAGATYTGGDIVAELIESNVAKFGTDQVNFSCLDITRSELPRVDLVFCRDCLVHLSNAQVKNAIRNICRSNSKWLLTTVFASGVNDKDIAQGQWRNLNLMAAPFNLPAPEMIFSEECSEGNGLYRDKSLALWDIDVIKRVVKSW